MIAILLLAAAAFLLYRLLGGAPVLRLSRQARDQHAEAKVAELTEYADRLRSANKFVSAEKVFLKILKIDHKHAPTYSRLGTIYAALKNYDDAIECFRIASQLTPAASNYYNLGLAYFENQNFMKAVAALEKSIMFEPSSQRCIALAKTFQKIGDSGRMIATLEQAVELDPQPRILWLLADAYGEAGREEDEAGIHTRIKKADPKDLRLRQLRTQQSAPTARLG
jgi:tetratricopeptide (TPR) repeat protein